MKLMDEKGRFFGKFNLFDLLVVVLLSVVVTVSAVVVVTDAATALSPLR